VAPTNQQQQKTIGGTNAAAKTSGGDKRGNNQLVVTKTKNGDSKSGNIYGIGAITFLANIKSNTNKPVVTKAAATKCDNNEPVVATNAATVTSSLQKWWQSIDGEKKQ